jgi:hypothetical protein
MKINIATAAEDIVINPLDDPITVIKDIPFDSYPPLNVTYIDWTNMSSYNISVVNYTSNIITCRFSGNITTNPQIVNLTGCVRRINRKR